MSLDQSYLTSAKVSIARLVKICAQKGLRYAVISPGSRNAPLTLSLAEDPRIESLNIVDERAAAFFALGMAQKTKQPVILCCTSGSAALNYSPAVVEAYYQKVPLLILTADRPNAWINQRAGQTMNQQDLYNSYIKKSFSLSEEPTHPEHIWYNDRMVNEAINIAATGPQGPVHINVPMREPLYDLVDASKVESPKIIDQSEIHKRLSIDALAQIKKEWSKQRGVLVIVGQGDHDRAFDQVIDRLAQLPQVVVLTEVTSNVRSEHVLPSIDRVIDSIGPSEYSEFAPDLVISCGAAIVSKKVRFMLREMKIHAHWHVDLHDGHIDTYQALTRVISIAPIDFFAHLLECQGVLTATPFKKVWLAREELTKARHHQYLSSCVWSDLQVMSMILNHIPSGVLHFSSSTPIRYAQLFGYRPELLYQCNRGVSGIDGCTSTAAGYAYVHKGWVTLITGDLSFFYDSNALWSHHLRDNLRIIMINNEGGNIFRYVKGPAQTSHLDQHFEATHQTSAEHIAKAHEVGYIKAANQEELHDHLEQLFDESHEGPMILEVFTPKEVNIEILRDYFDYLKQNQL